MNEAALIALHKQCSNNAKSLMAAATAGCFYCLRKIDPGTIKEWVGLRSQDALCPHCSIDSVLPDVDDPVVLRAMYAKWFGRH